MSKTEAIKKLCEGCEDGKGVRDDALPGCFTPPKGWRVVERCDTCDVYKDDLAAAVTVSEESASIHCTTGSHSHVIARGDRPSETRPDNETCLIPAEIQAALVTQRPALVTVLKNKVKAGRGVVPKAQVLELLDLVHDRIVDRLNQNEERRQFALRFAKRIRRALEGDVVRIGALRKIIEDLESV